MIFDRLARTTGYSSVEDSAGGLQLYGMPPAGVPVTEKTALKFSTFWCCYKVVTESTMILPWGVFETLDDGRRQAPENPVDSLLRRQPNPEMPAYSFKSTILGHALLKGNGYAEIERTRGGVPIALWLLDPGRVTPERDSQNRFYYKVRNDRGSEVSIPADDMFHLRGPSYDGLVGLSVIACARDSVSAAQAAERYGATFFGNGAVPGGIIQHAVDSKLTRMTGDTLDNFYKSWEERLKGSGKNSKVMYLDPGLTYKQISIEPDDAQFIETRKLSVPDICRWFRVPPHKVMDLEKATFSNIEQQSKEFVEDAIVPWVKRLEEEANLKLLDGNFYSKFSVQALLRGDSQARGEYYQKMLDRGVFTINDVLRMEDMNGIGENGDVRMVPLNMTTLERLGEDNATNMGN